MARWLLDPYQSQFMRNALAMAVVIGVLAPTVGVWVVLRRLAYLGDAMSHATLAGVAAAYLAGVSVTLGALAAGLVMGAAVGLLERQRRLPGDAAIGVVETVLFAAGILLIARSDGVGVELTHFLFGQIVTTGPADLALNAALATVALAVVAVAFDDLRAVTFDPLHAAQVGVSERRVRLALMLAISLAVVASLDTVGLLMTVALLVTPAAAARLVTDQVTTMTAVAIAMGTTASVGGLTASYHLATPPGPTIALAAAAWFAIAAAATWPRRTRHPTW